MKSLLRAYTFHLLALWLADISLGPAFEISGSVSTLLFAALILAALNVLVKPILKLLFLPVSALTLGLFTIVINAAVFYLFIKLVPQVVITSWQFPGWQWRNVIIPATTFNFWATLIFASLLVSLVTNFFTYLVK